MSLEEQYRQLEQTIIANTQIRDFTRIREAFDFACAAHDGQMRKDGCSPFVIHPIAAAEIVASMGLDEESVIAALLHDSIEDTDVTYDDIARRFGMAVADIVEGVTKLSRMTYASMEDAQMENLRKLLMAMAKDIRVIIIKMADRLHNMRTMEYQSGDKQLEKAFETMQIYAPIAHRLGMEQMKLELEDLSLRYLDPVGYKEITEGVANRCASSREFMENTEKTIKDRLAQLRIEGQVQSRVKDNYSIYMKMYGQNKQFEEVMDIFAFRVIVSSIAECYNVLGVIHELYRPLPGYFKDYIGTPKPNGYQSLHTTVIGREGVPFEVQIRTWEMHHTAEYGIAAHWKYKEGISGKGDEEKFEWIRRLLEAQQDGDSQDFFQTMRTDLFADEVFVFTPHGDVKSLPAGSCPIDFAYSIHSGVGNRMSGARVNGRIVPFNYELQSGDIVEILTSNASKGPSRDWLNLVKSSEARNKIRQWFKREKREENVVNGRAAFDSELRRNGIMMSDVTDDDFLPLLLKRFSFGQLDDMLAAIGYGGLTAQKVVNWVREEQRSLEKAGRPRGDGDWVSAASRVRPIHGIIVEGVENCLVKFARCCSPVPGDDIVGFVTRGSGVSIHRADCPNHMTASESEDNSERWIRVAWADDIEELYQTALAITAGERNGLIMDIATVLNSLKVKVDALNGKDLGGGTARVYITLSVRNRD